MNYIIRIIITLIFILTLLIVLIGYTSGKSENKNEQEAIKKRIIFLEKFISSESEEVIQDYMDKNKLLTKKSAEIELQQLNAILNK